MIYVCNNGELGDYRFEEADDERTWVNSDEPLKTDEERAGFSAEFSELKYVPEYRRHETYAPTTRDRCDDYWEIVKELLDSIGHEKELRALVDNAGHHPVVDGVINNPKYEWETVGDIAKLENRSHDQAHRALKKFVQICEELAVGFPYDEEKYLRSLHDRDKRDAYRSYMRTCRKNGKICSPEELEGKYQKRLKKRSQSKKK